MTKRQAIEGLFRAFGVVQIERAAIYVQDLEEHPARWTDTEVSAACTRTRQRWKHASLPPIGLVIESCFEVRAEDQKYRREQEQRSERANERPTEAQSALNREHARLAAELWDAGFNFCHVTQRWVPADAAKQLSPEQAPGPRIESTRAAVEALQRGELGKGSDELIRMRAAMRAWQARKPKQRRPLGGASHGMTSLGDALTQAQAEVFN